MWSRGNTHPLLVRMQTCAAPLEISVAVSQKIWNQPTSGPSNTTLGHIPKRCSIILKGHLFNYVHSSIICNSQNRETTYMPLSQRMDTFTECIVVKINNILKFSCKWIELEMTILSEATQTKNDEYSIILTHK